MHQFFVDREQIGTEYITITGEDVKHIKNVLRMKEGEEVRISDGAGGDFFCTIEKVTSEEVLAKILPKEAGNTELPNRIFLFQAVPKGERMEYVIQKAVELGVYEIIPVEMKYCSGCFREMLGSEFCIFFLLICRNDTSGRIYNGS